ncbi:ATP-dependent DNA ligase [Candidatus Babeliales bacterium]|nr:ATP-dependent DNA ligase [Candidatus Babeliales bacterium]
MNFKEVAELFEKLDKIKGRLEMTKLFAHILNRASVEEVGPLCYFALGTLNPQHIGTKFNFAQKNIIKMIAEKVGRTELEIKEKFNEQGDLGSIVELYEWEEGADLTVMQVYNALVEIEKIAGTGSQDKKSVKLQELLLELDVVSAKYVIRIVLGTVRLGFFDMTLIDALSWMYAGDKSVRDTIENAYSVCADIGYIAQVLKRDGLEAVGKMKMHVGIPIRPAAADRLPDIKAIMEKLGPCVAQPKLDGFRLQIHLDKTQDMPLIKFFSRNLSDMSDMFPEFVAACKTLPVDSFIADGEAMVFDPNTKLFLSFQETVKRRRKHGIEQMVSDLPLQLILFDVLYCNGINLLPSTHTERRVILEKVLKGTDGTLQCIDERKINTVKELENYFIQEIAAGLEGLVIKKPNAPYCPGKRNANWIKLKYQAADKLNDTIDVVVLGYYPGKGKRSQFGIGAFLVGIFNPRTESYETVAKVGTGLTDVQWVEFKKRCDALKVSSKPKTVHCDKSLEPMVWVEPSMVCEVLADNVTLSPVHTAGKTDTQLGFALRFPRFVNYRDDKNSYQATTVAELEKMRG